MQHRKRTKVTAALLALCMLVSLLPVTAFGLDPQSVELGKGSTIDGTGYHVTSVKNYSIAPDISERVIITNNDAGNSQTVANVMEVNTSGGRAKIVAGYGNRNPKEQGWTLKTTTDQAHVYEKESGLNMVGGVNASWFNINTGEPSGYLVMNGVVHHDSSSRAFIAAFDDGSVNVFREGTTLAQAEADQSAKQGKTVKILEAVDALVAMVWDGKVVITESGNSGYYPRTCVGIKADGTVVLFQADGTMAPRSVGYTAAEEARMMVALGCVAAIQLDEGGSSTYISQREGEQDVTMRNTPAGGSERVVSGTILVVSTVAASGEFDHAAVTPDDEYYTPGSSVTLTAEAMDFSGAAAKALPEDAVEEVEARGGITAGGRTYGCTSPVEEFITEEYYRSVWGRWNDAETLDQMVSGMDRTEDGLLADRAQLYGMERFALDRLTVLEGDISKLYEPGGRYVAAVYSEDDYGSPRMDSHWARLGDKITLRHVEEYEYYNPNTGEVYGGEEDIPEGAPFAARAVKYRGLEYEVAALVSVPTALSYRYYGADEFIMNDQTFIQDTGTDSVMLYAFDAADDGADSAMESFLADYTETQNPQFDYESKATYAAEFEGFRGMFLMLGGALSFIVGLVGVLNFFNAVLTGIITRRREFAVLQSIGMTGGQLKKMLVLEGLLYTLAAVLASLLLTVVMGPLLGTAVNSLFWFFTYRFTLAPILLIFPIFVVLGLVIPLLTYRSIARHTVVERLREAE